MLTRGTHTRFFGKGPGDPFGKGPGDPFGKGPGDPFGKGPGDPFLRCHKWPPHVQLINVSDQSDRLLSLNDESRLSW